MSIVNADEFDGAGTLQIEDQRFAVVPEWVIGAELSDAAVRVYVLLLRYGNSSGRRMPARATLAERLHRSKDSIDRALRELESAQIVRVERRRTGRVNLTNVYRLRTTDPQSDDKVVAGGGRRFAATPLSDEAARRPATGSSGGGGSRKFAATPGGRSAVTLAADLRPNPEQLTQRTPPPPPSTIAAARLRPAEVEEAALAGCGVTDVTALAARCQALRVAMGMPAGRWSAKCVTAAVQVAVKARGWPTDQVEQALLAVAADARSHSPMRLAEAGPWWDRASSAAQAQSAVTGGVDVAELEARLADTGGLRVRLQAEARAQLAAEGVPLTRTTVARRASELLDRQLAG